MKTNSALDHALLDGKQPRLLEQVRWRQFRALPLQPLGLDDEHLLAEPLSVAFFRHGKPGRRDAGQRPYFDEERLRR